MRFLLDMNASGTLLGLLLDSGHDVACVRDVDRKMSDSEILNLAARERIRPQYNTIIRQQRQLKI